MRNTSCLLLMLAACADPPDDTGPVDLGPVCGDDVCNADETVDDCPWDCGFRYVLVADLYGDHGGEYPGVDLDAVTLTPSRDDPAYAVQVVDAFILGDDNAWTDPTLALGPPDSECRGENLVSLGGTRGYVILSFGDDHPIRAGDQVTVHELSAKMGCNAQDDPWELSVTNTADVLDAVFVAGGSGQETVEIGGW